MTKEKEYTEDTFPIPDENGLPDESIHATAASPENNTPAFPDEETSTPPDSVPEEVVPKAPARTAAKPKRTVRKKKAETESAPGTANETEATDSEIEKKPAIFPVTHCDDAADIFAEEKSDNSSPAPRRTTVRRQNTSILSLEAGSEVETQRDRDDIIWHEIHNAYRTRKILTGQLGGVEKMPNNNTIIVVDYKGFRVVIPMKEMMIVLDTNVPNEEKADLQIRQSKLLSKMLGAEIDFIVQGIDSKTRAVVASRKEAMLKKRQTFYMDLDANGIHRIHEGRLVQARVIAVAEKGIRVEIFGVECTILARDLAWYWIGDAREYYSIGDNVLVRIRSVQRESLETITVSADVRTITPDDTKVNLKKCRVQNIYAGKVTDIHKGVVFIRLSNGVNAIAHSCYDFRTPGKKDDVSFVVTRLDEENGVAVGIITRVIRQNL